MGNLVVNGNSVYEVDDNCMKKKKRKNQTVSGESQMCGRKTENRRTDGEKDKTKRG